MTLQQISSTKPTHWLEHAIPGPKSHSANKYSMGEFVENGHILTKVSTLTVNKIKTLIYAKYCVVNIVIMAQQFSWNSIFFRTVQLLQTGTALPGIPSNYVRVQSHFKSTKSQLVTQLSQLERIFCSCSLLLGNETLDAASAFQLGCCRAFLARRATSMGVWMWFIVTSVNWIYFVFGIWC